MGNETQERLKQVGLSDEVWHKLRIAAAEQRTTMKELTERAILKELDGKK